MQRAGRETVTIEIDIAQPLQSQLATIKSKAEAAYAAGKYIVLKNPYPLNPYYNYPISSNMIKALMIRFHIDKYQEQDDYDGLDDARVYHYDQVNTQRSFFSGISFRFSLAPLPLTGFAALNVALYGIFSAGALAIAGYIGLVGLGLSLIALGISYAVFRYQNSVVNKLALELGSYTETKSDFSYARDIGYQSKNSDQISSAKFNNRARSSDTSCGCFGGFLRLFDRAPTVSSSTDSEPTAVPRTII